MSRELEDRVQRALDEGGLQRLDASDREAVAADPALRALASIDHALRTMNTSASDAAIGEILGALDQELPDIGDVTAPPDFDDPALGDELAGVTSIAAAREESASAREVSTPAREVSAPNASKSSMFKVLTWGGTVLAAAAALMLVMTYSFNDAMEPAAAEMEEASAPASAAPRASEASVEQATGQGYAAEADEAEEASEAEPAMETPAPGGGSGASDRESSDFGALEGAADGAFDEPAMRRRSRSARPVSHQPGEIDDLMREESSAMRSAAPMAIGVAMGTATSPARVSGAAGCLEDGDAVQVTLRARNGEIESVEAPVDAEVLDCLRRIYVGRSQTSPVVRRRVSR